MKNKEIEKKPVEEKVEKKESKKSTFWKDFKAFVSKGNVMDLAVAVIIGGVFGKIVSSLVNDIIMPLISLATGGVSVADWKWVITPAIYDSAGALLKAESALRYGIFLQAILDFLIISFFIFLALRILQKSKQAFESVTTEIKKDIKKSKKKKNKNGEIIEETTEIITETPKVEEAKPAPSLDENAVAQMTQGIKASNAKQEELLGEIRDLLRQQVQNNKVK